MNEPVLDLLDITHTSAPSLTAYSEGTNLWVFENLVFFFPLLKEDFVLSVSCPR